MDLSKDLYSAVVYEENGDITNNIFGQKQKALDFIGVKSNNLTNPFDVIGLDRLTINCNTDLRDENGEVTYTLDVERVLFTASDINA